MTDLAADERVVATNRKAYHEYFIIEKHEAGIALKGTEVKSLRNRQANLQDSYALVRNGEIWLVGMHVSPYEKGSYTNHEPKRDRKLLFHKNEIRRLIQKTAEKGLTLVPLKIYFKKNVAKVELALARGKKSYDKREAIKKRETERELRRHFAR